MPQQQQQPRDTERDTILNKLRMPIPAFLINAATPQQHDEFRQGQAQSGVFLPSALLLKYMIEQGLIEPGEQAEQLYLALADSSQKLQGLVIHDRFRETAGQGYSSFLETVDDIKPCDLLEYQDCQLHGGFKKGDCHLGIVFGSDAGRIRLIPCESHGGDYKFVPVGCEPKDLAILVDVDDEVPEDLPEGMRVLRTCHFEYTEWTVANFTRLKYVDSTNLMRKLEGFIAEGGG